MDKTQVMYFRLQTKNLFNLNLVKTLQSLKNFKRELVKLNRKKQASMIIHLM